jgi:multiple sugar transport system permease protein
MYANGGNLLGESKYPGGPGDATTTMTIVMYRSAFQNLEFGFGSAIAIVLLLVILAITGVQFLAARKLVFYQ